MLGGGDEVQAWGGHVDVGTGAIAKSTIYPASRCWVVPSSSQILFLVMMGLWGSAQCGCRVVPSASLWDVEVVPRRVLALIICHRCQLWRGLNGLV